MSVKIDEPEMEDLAVKITNSACILLLILSSGMTAEADDIWNGPLPRSQLLRRSWEEMGIDSGTARQLLRLAVQANPHDIECSVALIHMAHVYGYEDEADYRARAALNSNPNNPDLLVAQAAAMAPAPALDLLGKLHNLPGQEWRAERLAEWIRLGINIPDRGDMNKADYVTWADRLLYSGNVEHTDAVLDEGLTWTAKKDQSAFAALKERKPIVLALQKRTADAIAAQKEVNFPQITIEGKYAGIGDVFLMMGQPRSAILSFGGKEPRISEKVDAEDIRLLRAREIEQEHRRVLAWAYALDGKWEQGRALLDHSTDPMDEFILLQIYLRREKSGCEDRRRHHRSSIKIPAGISRISLAGRTFHGHLSERGIWIGGGMGCGSPAGQGRSGTNGIWIA